MRLLVQVAALDVHQVLEPNIQMGPRLKGCRTHRDPDQSVFRQYRGMDASVIRLTSRKRRGREPDSRVLCSISPLALSTPYVGVRGLGQH